MRILIVSQYFWPENVRINDLAKGLVQRGHVVTVLTGIPNYPDGKFYAGYGFCRNMHQNYCGVEVIRVPIIPRGKGKNVNLIVNYLSFVFFGTLFGTILCQKKYDAIFVFAVSPILMAIPAIFIKKARKVPLILYVLDLWPESISAVGAIKSIFVLNAVRKIVRVIYHCSDRILISSPGFEARIADMGINRSKINFWPQWGEDHYNIISNEDDSPECREMPSGFRIMFAGNIGAAQGFENIVKAATVLKEHRHIHWIIVGSGRMKPWVEEQIRLCNLEDSVHLLGKRPSEAMPTYFALADVLLVTLKKDPIFALTLPAKIQSYMACGRPIVACLNGEGARVVEESGAGFSCPAEDHESLAKCVLRMSALTKEDRIKMGLRGRAYFEQNFARDVLLAQLEQWIGAR